MQHLRKSVGSLEAHPGKYSEIQRHQKDLQSQLDQGKIPGQHPMHQSNRAILDDLHREEHAEYPWKI
jgi:hypothetical protein